MAYNQRRFILHAVSLWLVLTRVRGNQLNKLNGLVKTGNLGNFFSKRFPNEFIRLNSWAQVLRKEKMSFSWFKGFYVRRTSELALISNVELLPATSRL